MNKKILILGLICVFLVSCAPLGPKAKFTTERSSGDMAVPVEYVGGLSAPEEKTEGVLYISETSTRFVSDKGTVHLNMPTSSINSVSVKTEAKLNLERTVIRFLFLSVFALLIKDKSELISLEFKGVEKNPPIFTVFKIKVGTGQTLKEAIIAKKEFAVAEMPRAEVTVAQKTAIEREWDQTIATNTISAYEEFITTHSNPEFREKARLRLKELFLELDWKNTVTANSISKYEEFLKRNPGSKFTEEARAILEKLKKEKWQ